MMSWALQSIIICATGWLLLSLSPGSLRGIKQELITLCFLLCLVLPSVIEFLPNQYNQMSFEVATFENSKKHVVPVSQYTAKSSDFTEFIDTKPEAPNKFTFEYMIILVWFCGFFLALLHWSRRIRIAKRMVNNGRRYESNNKYGIPVFFSTEASVPFLYAFGEKAIVIPARLTTLEHTKLNLIILHELCHYRRRDHWRLWLSMLTSAVYWFNPLIHYLARYQQQLIELNCDQALIQSGLDRFMYAQTLVSCAKNNPSTAVGCFMTSPTSQLKSRVNAIVSTDINVTQKNHPTLMVLLSSILILAGCIRFNDTQWVDARHLVSFEGHDLPSLKQSKLQPGQVHVAAFYDGKDNQLTFINLKIMNQKNQASWLKLGPLKKFNDHIHTWYFTLLDGAHFSGEYTVEGVNPDGVIDGVAMGMISADINGNIDLLKSKALLNQNDIPNVVCAWPLGLNDHQMIAALPQLSTNNPDTVERLICGAQLVGDGIHRLN